MLQDGDCQKIVDIFRTTNGTFVSFSYHYVSFRIIHNQTFSAFDNFPWEIFFTFSLKYRTFMTLCGSLSDGPVISLILMKHPTCCPWPLKNDGPLINIHDLLSTPFEFIGMGCVYHTCISLNNVPYNLL